MAEGDARGPAPKGGKGAVMTARITQEMRTALEAEAARTGRTLAQVAELWMERGREGRSGLENAFDMPTAGAVIRDLVRYAEDVRATIADPGQDAYAREALLYGWRTLIARLPHPGPSAEYLARLARHREVRSAARKMLEALRGLQNHNPDSEVLRACLAAPVVNIFATDYKPGSFRQGERDTIADLLVQLAEADDEDVDPVSVGASLNAADRLFGRLDALLAALGSDPDGPLMDAMSELIKARKAENEAMSTQTERRREALDKAAALLLKYATAPVPDAR